MTFYEICLATGIVLSIIFLFAGSVFYDAKFKLVLLNVFLICFGGAGIMIGKVVVLSVILNMVISIIIGLLVSFLMYKGVIKPLINAENTSVVSEKEFIGLDAEVLLQVSNHQLGQVTYVVNGIIFNSPARSISDKTYKAGEKVLIVDIKENVIFVD